MQEEDDNMTEIANAIFSDLLTENPDQALSAFGSNRVMAERWKGMSNEQKEQIRKKQMEQIEERRVSNLNPNHSSFSAINHYLAFFLASKRTRTFTRRRMG